MGGCGGTDANSSKDERNRKRRDDRRRSDDGGHRGSRGTGDGRATPQQLSGGEARQTMAYGESGTRSTDSRQTEGKWRHTADMDASHRHRTPRGQHAGAIDSKSICHCRTGGAARAAGKQTRGPDDDRSEARGRRTQQDGGRGRRRRDDGGRRDDTDANGRHGDATGGDDRRGDATSTGRRGPDVDTHTADADIKKPPARTSQRTAASRTADRPELRRREQT